MYMGFPGLRILRLDRIYLHFQQESVFLRKTVGGKHKSLVCC
jgi:hypothetical protein